MQRLSTICLLGVFSTLTAVTFPRPAAAQHEEAVAEALAPYWQREAIVAVTPRAASKAGAVELAAGVSIIPTDPAWVYVPLSGRLSYHFTERWGLQGSFSYLLGSETGDSTPTEQQQLHTSVAVLWAPAYGKVSIYGRVVHLELQLAAGGGVLRCTVPDSTMQQQLDSVEAASFSPSFHLGAALSFFAANRFVFRLGYRQHLHLLSERLDWPAAFGLDIGVLLGGRR